jgi:hypothetical protein
MKKIWGITIILLAAVALCFFLNTKKSTAPPGSPVARSSSAGQPETPSAPQKDSATAPAASPADGNSAPPPMPAPNLAANAAAVQPVTSTVPPLDIPPEIVLQNVRHAITQYGTMFGGNPVGTNPEITAALAGDNPQQINFIKPEAGMRINNNGELVDPWGTPLFFHQLSGADTEIRSAGPDRKMWTPDDLVAR